jgi:uncharacterized protein (UPF0210 family)
MIAPTREVGATISRVKVRAVTLGLDLPTPEVRHQAFADAGGFLADARRAFEDSGIEVQRLRVAGGNLDPTAIEWRASPHHWAANAENAARSHGIEELSLGRLSPNAHAFAAEDLAPILAAGEIVYLSADLIEAQLPSLAMARACAVAVKRLAASTDRGSGTLRFAATANCPPNIPFMPAAYHIGGPPRFAIAVEAADLVVSALKHEGGMSAIENRLVDDLEAACEPLERIADRLAAGSGYGFVGIDLSPAPFPSDDRSIGAAIEHAGVDRFGAPGTLYVSAMITRAIRRTRVRRCGFSGLMLPVLEDSVLARRAAEHSPSMHELLLYSAVCGTGLDTIPLPDQTSETELAGVYLDVAALSVALNGKPLTVRVMPVPGAASGDATEYEFDHFANSRVLRTAEAGVAKILERGQ